MQLISKLLPAGHALFDFLYSAFNMMQVLQVYTPEVQLLLASHQVEPSVARALLLGELCFLFRKAMLLACGIPCCSSNDLCREMFYKVIKRFISP